MSDIRVSVEINEPEFNRQVVAYERMRMSRLQRRTATQARQDVPVRTGHLGRSHTEGPIRQVGPRTVSGQVTAEADYALYVHEGTRPHLIFPNRAQALRFQVGGRTVFAAVVRHPGTQARPWLRNAGLRIAAQEADG